jgi:hypothetical protein
MKCRILALLGVLLLAATETARAMPLVMSLPQRTWREEAAFCEVVVFGTLDQPGRDSGGWTDCLVIDCVLKNHPILRGGKVLNLGRELRVKDPCRPPRMLIFCDVFKGKLDPYRGVVVGSACASYLKGLLALDRRDRTAVLRHCFAYLDHTDATVAADAALEFQQATEKDLATAARHFSTRKLRSWLLNEKTPSARLPLYSRLLGHAGSECDTELLRRLADRLAKQEVVPVEVLIALARLDPAQGLVLLRKYLHDASCHFAVRYSALKALRILHKERPEVVNKQLVVDCLTVLLDQPDIADLAIEDLRRWQYWDQSEKIITLYKSAKTAPVTQRAIVRFALQCPTATAACFVMDMRRLNPKELQDIREILEQEAKFAD